MPEWVHIVHPSLGDDQPPGLVTKEAYLEVHKAAGWRLHKAPAAEPETVPEPVTKSAKK